MNALLWDPALEQVAQVVRKRLHLRAQREPNHPVLGGRRGRRRSPATSSSARTSRIGTLGAFTAAQLAAGWVNESTSYDYTPIVSGGSDDRALHAGRLGEDPVRRVRRRGVLRRRRRRAGAVARLRLRERGQLRRPAPLGRGDEWRAVRGRSHRSASRASATAARIELVRDRRHPARNELRRRLARVRDRRGLRCQGPLRDGSPGPARRGASTGSAAARASASSGSRTAPTAAAPGCARRGLDPEATEATRAPGPTAARAPMEGRAATAAPARTREPAAMPGPAPTGEAGRAADRSPGAT